MTSAMYQQLWEEMKTHIFAMVNRFFETGILDKELNKTLICLVPKKIGADTFSDFRPISLCNVSYKIIAKIMSQRLKKCLPSLISETQSAFVEGRLITDNVLIAQELVHALNTGSKTSKNFLAIKTDISKAFDRVEWQFLRETMTSLGFGERWIQLVMECVSSVTYQILINGEPHGHVVPTRGLRQGDPLSPFLFVLCTEMLIQKIKRVEGDGLITGISIARNAPAITHLLFADDSLLFCKANDEELTQLNSIIQEYTKESGQLVNYRKSSLLFGKKIPVDRRSEIKRKMGIQKEGGGSMYLGLPDVLGSSKVQSLHFLKERLKRRVSGWQTRYLSQGGKEVLLKSVAMALPTYSMSCFRLPKATCKSIVALMADFWWNNKSESRGMHWHAWPKLCKTKGEGGLGFRDLEAFNTALLGKQLWRIITQKDSLLTKVFKSRYFAKTDGLNASLGSRPSFVWRSIHSAQHLLKEGLKIDVGNGNSINIWKDPWLGSSPAHPIRVTKLIPPYARNEFLNVSRAKDLLSDRGREWNINTLQLFLPQEVIKEIVAIRPGGDNTEDGYSWVPSACGKYTVKSAYWLEVSIRRRRDLKGLTEANMPSLDPLYKQVWNLDVAPKIKHFIWKCLANAVPVAENLEKRHISRDAHCPRCPDVVESLNHMLFQCTLARQVWAIASIPIPREGVWTPSHYTNIYRVLNVTQINKELTEAETLSPWLIWRLWKNRNELLFKGREWNAQILVSTARDDADEWEKRAQESSELEDLLQRPRTRQVFRSTNWRRPPAGWLKCNVDASWNRQGTNSGLGWVLRNNEGKVLWLGKKAIASTSDVLSSEAEAMRWAMISIARMGYTKIIFESDSKALVDHVNDRTTDINVKPIIHDLRHLLGGIIESTLIFSSREGNKLADRVAKDAGSSLVHESVLYSIVPICYNLLVSQDIVSSS